MKTQRASGIVADLWRDYDPALNNNSGMHLGRSHLGQNVITEATDLYSKGVRLVQLDRPVSMLDDSMYALRCFTLVRELTSHGIVVNWNVELDEKTPWQMLSHLYPPATLGGADKDDLRDWISRHRIYRLIYRQGPGFLQVRDHRFGGFRRFTIAGTDHLRAVQSLLAGVEETFISQLIVRDFEKANLVGRVNGRLWWLPCRARRWPIPSELA